MGIVEQKKIKKLTNVNSKRGVALIVVMIFLALLTSLGVWLSMNSVIEMKTTASLKNYEEAFNLADGASQLSIRYLLNTTPPPPSWDPRQTGTITQGLPAYMNQKTLAGGRKKLKPQVVYKGYSVTPPPGWMLNWQGYSAFHRLKYVARGVGEIPTRGAKSTVDVLLLKISQ